MMNVLLMINEGRSDDLDPSEIAVGSGFVARFDWPDAPEGIAFERLAPMARGCFTFLFVGGDGGARVQQFSMSGLPPADDPIYDELTHWVPAVLLDRIRSYAASPLPVEDICFDVDADELLNSHGANWTAMLAAISAGDPDLVPDEHAAFLSDAPIGELTPSRSVRDMRPLDRDDVADVRRSLQKLRAA